MNGSTDSTPEILKGFPNIEQIHLSENKGKGNALKVGFEKALELGYEYAITIDSDGQHFSEDIPTFIDFQIFGFGLRQVLNFKIPNVDIDYTR